MLIYNDKEFNKNISSLNALLNLEMQWKFILASKDFEDVFGVIIKEGDRYFQRYHGKGYHKVIRMSRQSMDKFVFALFDGNLFLQDIANNYFNLRLKEYQNAVNKLGLIINKNPRGNNEK